MAIIFDPTEMLKKVAPVSKIKRMVSGRIGLKRTILSQIGTDALPIDESSVATVARKTLRGYKERVAKAVVDNDFERAAGTEVKKEIIANPRQLIQRVQNEVIFQIHQGIREKYKGKKARWLPSSAEEPRPNHATAYGKVYTIGEGLPVGDDGETVEPGDEWGCQCGVEILTDETQLDLS
jgi:hypothetical protein